MNIQNVFVPERNTVVPSFVSRLADFAFMYEQVVADFGLTAKHKWVVFGGSVLHGPMAAWFRLKVNR